MGTVVEVELGLGPGHASTLWGNEHTLFPKVEGGAYEFIRAHGTVYDRKLIVQSFGGQAERYLCGNLDAYARKYFLYGMADSAYWCDQERIWVDCLNVSITPSCQYQFPGAPGSYSIRARYLLDRDRFEEAVRETINDLMVRGVGVTVVESYAEKFDVCRADFTLEVPLRDMGRAIELFVAQHYFGVFGDRFRA